MRARYAVGACVCRCQSIRSASRQRPLNVRFGSKPDIPLQLCDVRCTPESRHSVARLKCPLSANKRLPSEQLSYTTHYFPQSGENPSSPFQTKTLPDLRISC